jgi:cyanophycinase-like exopeptidase
MVGLRRDGMLSGRLWVPCFPYTRITSTDPAIVAAMQAANAAARAAADSDFVKNILNQAEGIFITGGDQWGYIQCWDGTSVESIIENRFNAKEIVLGGTSAGLHVLGQHDFTAEHDSVTTPEALANPGSNQIALSSNFIGGIGPLAGVITDPHFGVSVNGSDDRMRMGRLVTFLARLGGGVKGLGVDANTAVALECEGQDDGMAQVFGQFAYFVSGSSATMTPIAPNTPLDYRNIRVRRVGPGVQFNFAAAWGTSTAPGEVYYIDAVGGVLIPHPGSSSIY